jgi:hypothetical protein
MAVGEPAQHDWRSTVAPHAAMTCAPPLIAARSAATFHRKPEPYLPDRQHSPLLLLRIDEMPLTIDDKRLVIDEMLSLIDEKPFLRLVKPFIIEEKSFILDEKLFLIDVEELILDEKLFFLDEKPSRRGVAEDEVADEPRFQY